MATRLIARRTRYTGSGVPLLHLPLVVLPDEIAPRRGV